MRFILTVIFINIIGHSLFAVSLKDTINSENFSSLVFEKALFDKVNALRKADKKNPYIFNQMLHKAAKDHADYLVKTGKLTHEQDNLESKTVYNRVRKYVKTTRFAVGENLARTFVLKPSLNYNESGKASMSTAYTYEEAVNYMFNAWLQSAFHKKNMLSDKYSIAAISAEYNPKDGSITAVQVFAHFG